MWRFFCFAEKGGLMDMEQEELMMLVPPLFSLKDIPEETVYVFRLFTSILNLCKAIIRMELAGS
jgi:hypothetical protein